MEYSLKTGQIWLNWCQYIWPVDANRNSIKMRITCIYGMIEAKSLATRLTRSHVGEGGGGGIMRLWKHEGKEKKIAQEDGSKGYAYRLTPQRF